MPVRLPALICFIALLPGLAVGQNTQTNPPASTSDPSNLAGAVQQLRELMAQQQAAMVQQRDTMQQQQKTMQEQQKQLAEQQQEISQLRQELSAQPQSASATDANGTGGASLVNASMTSSSLTAPPQISTVPQGEKESPLSFRIGGADFTPGGFMDFTSIFRTTNVGTLGTNFFNIPYSNTIAGHLTENRFTAQNSRIALKITDKFGQNDVTGYFEMDFLGNDAANVEVTSNSHTFRERVYWVDVKHDKWEIVAGQMWSWLTPNRVGLGPLTSDVFYSLNMDFNYQVGLTWTRAPEFRVVYHPDNHWAFGVALENPEQFGGQGEVTFPSAFNAQVAGEIDEANLSTTPNLHPDVITKLGYDTNFGSRHLHVEAAGLLSGFRITDIPLVTGATFVHHAKEGGGVEGAINYEAFKTFHLVANAFWSDGGGRYIFGMAPDLVVQPINAPGTTCTITGTATKTAVGCDANLSLVHSGSGLAGFEYQVTPRVMLFSYFGAMYAQRRTFLDITSTAATQPFIGFGGPNSANSNNRNIQEPTVGWVETFWKKPQYGALQLITQGSYLTRSPWFVAAGAPKNAHLAMAWADVRYTLP
jgi:hypothetical protein